MKRTLLIAMFVVSLFSVKTLAQETLSPQPTKIILNIGTDVCMINLDENLSGSIVRRDITPKVELDGGGKVYLKIPERKISYKGKYEVIWADTFRSYQNGKMTHSVSATAVVVDWEKWSEDSALEQVSAEIEWRAVNEFTLLVDEVDHRIYATPEAFTAIRKLGASLTAEEFKLPSSNYTHSFKNTKGAIIFDAEDSKLYMRLINEKGYDSTFQIKKNGEVKMVTPPKEKAERPRLVS